MRLDDGTEVALPLADLRRAKLVLTDALIAATAQPKPAQRDELRKPTMDTAVSRPELLLVADAVAREKSIDREEVIEAMEQAIQKAGRAKYGSEKDIRATIDRKTGDVRLSRWTEAVEVVENEETQIPVHIARKFKPDIEIGGHLVDPLPPIDFGRIAAQTAKQVIVQRVREYERKKQYDEFKDRVGEIINGLVKRTEYGNLMVELGRAEALLRRDELIPRESFRNGDRVRAYIYDVREEPRGPQIFLSPHAPRLPGQAVRAGGAGNLRRHHRDQGGQPRPGQPRQDGGDQPRQLDRPGRRLRRHARQPGAGGGAGAAGREDRHHPLVRPGADLRGERAGPGRGHQGGDGRGGRPRRGGGAGRAALAWPSAAAARTCAWPASSPAGTSTS